MTEIARKRRWSRFVDPLSGAALIVPIDHGLTIGPVPGIERIGCIASWLSSESLTGVVVHKGLAEQLGLAVPCGMMIHLNGTLSLDTQPDSKVLLTSVDAALRLGADGVSIQTNFHANNVGENLRLIGKVVDEAHLRGFPVLLMLYDKNTQGSAAERIARLRHLIRASVELGVDALKLAAPNDFSAIPELIEGVQRHTHIVFAGGDHKTDEQLFELARTVIQYGGKGLCVGRNVFQRDDPSVILRELLTNLRAARVAAGGRNASRDGGVATQRINWPGGVAARARDFAALP
ncbi:class I fructose-bisphosphate aldolase [Paraburkholderia dilworthii]|uniref:class I fructose-bisphosphate aldolase n=1 Tax=Paraburkholderia dilworthii TaxID=948106 RepID=UPI000418AABD|nr:aldolase [Paraburkholderia dilworthii]